MGSTCLTRIVAAVKVLPPIQSWCARHRGGPGQVLGGVQIGRDAPSLPVTDPSPAWTGGHVSGPTVHVLRLDTIGGVERDFVSYIRHPTVTAGDHRVLVVGRPIHPHLREPITGAAAVEELRRWRGLRLPTWLRPPRLRRILRRVEPARLILWNHLGDAGLMAIADDLGIPVVYYEHGAGWLRPSGERVRGCLERAAGVVCNSRAARRLLADRFGWHGMAEVHPYGLRSDARPPLPQCKVAPVGRPWRLGMAGRMIPLKGYPLALHATAELRRRGHPVELHLAGTGPDEAQLRALAVELGLGESVVFRGVVADMSEFYRGIDLMLVPSLREPFGLVSIEAAAWGCPVIAAAVDGLPETMEPEVTGLALPCTEALDGYAAVGGRVADLPEQVYDPVADALTAPRYVAPTALADAVGGLIVDPERFAAMSAAAGERIPRRFDFDRHVLELDAAFARLAP